MNKSCEGNEEKNKYDNVLDLYKTHTIVVERGDTKLAYCTVIIVSILAILVLVKK